MTPKAKLATLMLGRPVGEWITEARGHGLSWRAIAEQLADDTGGEITVTHETLRSWVAQDAA